MSDYHIPVMLKEVLDFLNIKKDHWYVDCNLGGGGHTEGILKKGGKVIGIDLDPDAIKEVAKNHAIQTIGEYFHEYGRSDSLILYQSNFADLQETLTRFKTPKVSGILYDLGVSSYQLETTDRGFSFNKDAPLDMRMNPDLGVSAQDLLAALSERELSELFLKYGEENFAKPIARRIVEYRKTTKLIQTTDELAKIILTVRRRSPSDRTHPATRVFQALRIAVNDELNSLKVSLPQAFEALEKSGRLVVISFHSLEDRIVKNYFRELEEQGLVEVLTKKPIETSEAESEQNPRARSGKLRAISKL